jgi:hypothetical protein
MGVVTFPVGSEPTAIRMIPCGDRDGRRYISRGFRTHGYSHDPLWGSLADSNFYAVTRWDWPTICSNFTLADH